MSPITIVSAVAIALLMFLLTAVLFRRLEDVHPDKYDEMGRPSFSAPNRENVTAALRFVARREHRELDDKPLSRLSDALLVCGVLYVALFVYAVSTLKVTSG